MGKLSKILLNSIFLNSAYASPFSVTDCSNDGALSLEIDEDYFINNIEDDGSYDWDAGDELYTKTITADNLDFSIDNDDIILSHTIDTTPDPFSIGSTTIRLAEESIVFECRYSRSVSLTEGYTIEESESPTSNRGGLSYSLSVNADLLGRNTEISIHRNHILNQITPKVISCRVNHENHEIYPMHSFKNGELCVDLSRKRSKITSNNSIKLNFGLEVTQTKFGSDISFSMRTFWFDAQTSSVTGQNQTMKCDLRLDPIATISTTQPDDCSCHTKEECFDSVLSTWSEWSTCSVTCGAGEQSRTRNCDQNCTGISSDDLLQTTTCNETDCPIVPAVLLLNSFEFSAKAMVVGYNGEYDDDINFTFNSVREVHGSCAATLKNEMYLFGGGGELGTRRDDKLFKITDCALKDIGEMGFNFRYGGCNTFSFGIMLCFSSSTQTSQPSVHNKECHSFDGSTFKKEEPSHFNHRNVMALGSYNDSPFVTGHWSGVHGLETEILDYKSSKWVSSKPYPFSNGGDRITRYATASINGSVYILGGVTMYVPSVGTQYLSTIAQYENGDWKNVGNLAEPRHHHSAISFGSSIFIAGGGPQNMNPEVWDMNSLQSQIINPSITGRYEHMAIFSVNLGFCSKN